MCINILINTTVLHREVLGRYQGKRLVKFRETILKGVTVCISFSKRIYQIIG